MKQRAGIRGAIAGAMVVALVFAALAAPAHAVNIIEGQGPGGEPETAKAGWQAGACTTDTPKCKPEEPSQLFTQAAGHPKASFTQIIVRHSGFLERPVGKLKTVLVDLPAGLSVNPQATVDTEGNPIRCELDEGKFPVSGCPAKTQVGISAVTVSAGIPPVTLPPVTIPEIPVYNLVPREGEPARFGFPLPLGLGEVFLNAGVAWDGGYHEYFTIHVPSIPAVRILKNRLVFDGTIGRLGTGGAFITNPSTCFDPNVESFATVYNAILHADSVEEEAPENQYDVAAPAPPGTAFLAGSQRVESPLPRIEGGERVRPTGCEKVSFEPSASADPSTGQTDSPAGGTVEVRAPFEPSAPIYQSNARVADVSLPQGMGLNPSAANGLRACTDAQFGRGTRNPVSCPAASKIGTVAIDTPPLPDGTLTGSVYLGQQLSRDPTSGDEYRIFIDAESASRGLSIRLLGNVSANPQTGQLTARVHEAPQLPFDSVRVTLDSGAEATLTSPPTCGPNKVTHAMTAWSGTPDEGPQDEGFTLKSAPGGGACAKTLAARPFAPSFAAKLNQPQGRRLRPVQCQHLPLRRQSGAERRHGRPASGPDHQARRRQVLPACGARRRGGSQRDGRGGQVELPEQQPRRHRLGHVRQRLLSHPHRRKSLPHRPLQRGSSLPGNRHPRHGRPL